MITRSAADQNFLSGISFDTFRATQSLHLQLDVFYSLYREPGSELLCLITYSCGLLGLQMVKHPHGESERVIMCRPVSSPACVYSLRGLGILETRDFDHYQGSVPFDATEACLGVG